MVAACAETVVARPSTATIESIRPGIMRGSSFQARCHLLGMLLVTLEDLQASLQQVLQFGVVRVGDKRRLQRAVDVLVVGNFVFGVGFIEVRALQSGELGALLAGALRERAAGLVI